ncbi:MAG TPA: hypothetical protein VJP77_00670 [Planctomycetota bacterium]|nr:hypothetical protein [Planctomycetota bacterium]
MRLPERRRWSRQQRGRVAVTALGVPSAYRRAFLEILVSTSAYYRRLFGAGALGNIELVATYQPGSPVRLWTNGADRIYLQLGEPRHLHPPTRGGPRYLHGLPHELAHMLLYRSLVHVGSLSEGWGEGWAVFLSSQLAVPHLHRHWGSELWPEPYDFLATEGPASLARNLASRTDPVTEAVRVLHSLWSRWGTRQFCARFQPLLKQFRPASDYERTVRGWLAERGSPGVAADSSRSPTRAAQRRP